MSRWTLNTFRGIRTSSVCFFWPGSSPWKQGEKWLVRSDNLHGASSLGGRDEHMVRPLQLGVDGPAHGRIALHSCISVARLTLIDQWQCLSRVPSFSPPRLYWRLGTHIEHPRRWRLPVPTRPCAAPACIPERSNYTSRHPPSSIFDVSTQDDARSAKNFSYLFMARVFWLYTPVPRHTCTSDAPTWQTGLPSYRVSRIHVLSARLLTVCLPCLRM